VLRSWVSSVVGWTGALVAAGAAAPGVLIAQAQQAQEGFVPMAQAGPRETLPATPLVFAAYAFVWVAVLAYVFLLWRRLNRVERDLAALTSRLETGPRS
jgi:CcmD family protein